MKRLTTDHIAKMTAARQASHAANEERRTRRLVVGEWEIYRIDEYNLVVSPLGNTDPDRFAYIPDITNALRVVYQKLLEAECLEAATLKDVLTAIEAAEARISAAVREWQG